MISSEVQRTLVKSPPELWAELSDPTALSRHLGELGDIRIVRTEPESTVEWATENTTGTVSIKPSAWGTKVTLSVTRELDEPTSEPEPAPSEPVAESAVEPTAVVEPEPERVAIVEPEPEPVAVFEPEPTVEPKRAVASTPAPARRGFFARLFGRRAAPQVKGEPIEESIEDVASAEQRMERPVPALALERPAAAPEAAAALSRTPDPPDAFAAVRQALASETFAEKNPFAVHKAAQPTVEPQTLQDNSRPAQIADISAELMAAEEAAGEEVTAVLTAVLDRLGAAHHRPFSRA